MVVLAAGINTPLLAAKLGVQVPLEDKPGTVNIVTGVLPPLLKHILVTGRPLLLGMCTQSLTQHAGKRLRLGPYRSKQVAADCM